jgi:hypothetical protein
MSFWFGALAMFFFCLIGPAAAAAQRKQKKTAGKAIAISATVSIILSLVTIQFFKSTASHARYKGEIASFVVLPNNYVRVWFSVKNVGTDPGKPSCLVSIQPTNIYGDPIGSGGFDALDGSHTVAAGDTYSAYMDIVVSDNAASDVTSKSMISISNC